MLHESILIDVSELQLLGPTKGKLDKEILEQIFSTIESMFNKVKFSLKHFGSPLFFLAKLDLEGLELESFDFYKMESYQEETLKSKVYIAQVIIIIYCDKIIIPI